MKSASGYARVSATRSQMLAIKRPFEKSFNDNSRNIMPMMVPGTLDPARPMELHGVQDWAFLSLNEIPPKEW